MKQLNAEKVMSVLYDLLERQENVKINFRMEKKEDSENTTRSTAQNLREYPTNNHAS